MIIDTEYLSKGDVAALLDLFAERNIGRFSVTQITEKLAKINNIILELEKSAINLGATISERGEEEGIQLTEADREAIREEKEKEKHSKSAR